MVTLILLTCLRIILPLAILAAVVIGYSCCVASGRCREAEERRVGHILP